VTTHRLAHSHVELDAAEVAVVGIRRDRLGVAEHRVGEDRVDLRDQPAGVDEQGGAEAAVRVTECTVIFGQTPPGE
jgi:hypothetical protein